MTRGGKYLSLSASALALLHTPLAAQSIPETAPAIERDDPEFEIDPTRIGPFDVTVGVELSSHYDSNLYALPDNEIDDVVFELAPQMRAVHSSGPVEIAFGTRTVVRRHADQTSEDSEAVRFSSDLTWSPHEEESLSLGAAFERAIEDRGDPEARDILAPGPRELDIWSGAAQYRRARGRILLDIRAQAAKYDALSSLDDNRDFSAYSGSATVGMRVGGSMFLTATGFANRRDFRLETDMLGQERNATTWGGRVGFDLAPGGLVEGSLSAGVFRYEPDEPTFEDRTGFSLAGNLIYRPRRRTAFILDASSGDVATFRTGATGRTDLTGRITWQQEIRHNLRSSFSAGYRRSRFRGTDVTEKTFVGRGELELLFSRHLSLVAEASYGDRTSDLDFDEFDRFRGGLSVRLRY
ncbi:outer membrane beta-barrel protein [Qipengyuania xiapuensis]|uniref:Outer membrane beta-barrel protein n=1 Tax=Qipengyuania xiapuensis TaxID=2867236 RepID=A0ABX8ZVN3_9SPHN|nr:outer membrane beta-barrel protein [Qipengyuania xiapuensis]QZD93060.1 outer membrane beta-barrel protein [Qipengyuania xiapuensis]